MSATLCEGEIYTSHSIVIRIFRTQSIHHCNIRVPDKLVILLRNLSAKSQLVVKIGIRLGDWFTAEIGSRQGYPISPLSFILLLEKVMETAECSTVTNGVNVHGLVINDLRYADVVDLLAEKRSSCSLLSTNYMSVLKNMGCKSTQIQAMLWFWKRDKPSPTYYSWHKHTRLCVWICLPWRSDNEQ